MSSDKRTLRQQWRVLRDLRREKFDIAFNLNGADRTIFFTALAGARWRIAYPGGRWHFWNPLLVPTWTPRQEGNLPVFEQRRQVLADCGMELASPYFGLKPDEDSSRWASSVIDRGTVHLSLNASKATKECTVEFHAELLRAIWKQVPEARVLATGGAEERQRQRLTNLAAMVSDPRLQVLADSPTIPQLAALLARCSLHVGPDSGVLHLAVALDVPSLSFFRDQGLPRPFMPAGAMHRVISVPCNCPDTRDAPCERLGRAECLAQLEPAAVARVVLERLGKHSIKEV